MAAALVRYPCFRPCWQQAHFFDAISRSTTEAKYRAIAHTAAKLTWFSFLLCDLGARLSSTHELFCDNCSALYMTINTDFHAHSKNIDIDYHYVYECVALGLLHTQHFASSSRLADILLHTLLLSLSKPNLTSSIGLVCRGVLENIPNKVKFT